MFNGSVDSGTNGRSEESIEKGLNTISNLSDSLLNWKKTPLITGLKSSVPEEKIVELEDKVARTFAEMENQRRRFEKEKDDAFEYGGFSFAKESLNLLDNLERSKTSLENDDKLKNTETLKKVIEHLDIVNKDIISIFKKN